MGPNEDVAIRFRPAAIRDHVAGLAKDFKRRPRDAALDYSTGWVEVIRERHGRRLKVGATSAALLDAFRGDDAEVPVTAKLVRPEEVLARRR